MAEKTTMVDDAQEKDELVLEDNQLVCALTNKVVKATDKELTLQSMIDMMAEEYGSLIPQHYNLTLFISS